VHILTENAWRLQRGYRRAVHQVDHAAQRMLIRDDAPAPAIHVEARPLDANRIPLGVPGNELARGDDLKEETGARLRKVQRPPGADARAELDVSVRQQVALVVEVRQSVDIRALERAGHEF